MVDSSRFAEADDTTGSLPTEPTLASFGLGPSQITAQVSSPQDARVEADLGAPLTRRELRTRTEAPAYEKRRRSRNARTRSAENAATAPGKPSGRRSKQSRQAPNEGIPHISTAVRPVTNRFRQQVVTRLFSLAALLFAGALMLGTSLPALAIPNHHETDALVKPVATRVESQTLTAELGSETVEPIQRDSWGVTSYAEMLRLKYGTRDYSYSVDYTGPVRWPFPYAVPITSGFGDRASPCRGCSSDHRGIDLAPGGSVPIYAIADGVVSSAQEGWSYGTHIFIDHEINGQRVTSLYAHMATGSTPLQPGQQVKVGDFVGMVGNTGASTGNHLHLEIRPDGVPVDPLFWLRLNAG